MSLNLQEGQLTTLRRELGLGIIAEYGQLPVLDEHRGRVNFPKCPFCRRRPELRQRPGSWLKWKTGLSSPDHPETIDVPRYEILPCCSAQYKVEINHVTRRQKLAIAAEAKKKASTQSTIYNSAG